MSSAVRLMNMTLVVMVKMFSWSSLFLVFSALASVKSLSRNDERIVGGEPASITELPFLAYVEGCGGSIISKQHILTAAHCLPLALRTGATVLVGTENILFGGRKYKVKSAKVHKQYQSGGPFDNDIAIVTLTEDIEFSDKVQLIQLADSGFEVPDGMDLTVSGWGDTKPIPGTRGTVDLRTVTVRKVSDARCKKAYSGKEVITETMLCAGMTTKSVCHGDSGGPIIQKTSFGNIQVGVVSWGYGCADPKYPAVYAKVSALRKWIEENTKLK